MANFVNCDTGSGNGGDGCTLNFQPVVSMSIPDVGLPEFTEFNIPDFNGLDISGLFKALEMIGLDPCALLQPIADLTQDIIEAQADILQGVIDGVASFPQATVDALQTTIQGDLDGFFAPMDTLMSAFDDPCETIAGAANDAFNLAHAVDSDYRNGISSP